MKPLSQIRAGLGSNHATLLTGDGSWLRVVLHCGPVRLLVIATQGGGWEHASVSVFTDMTGRSIRRCPTWEEMDFVKDFFWSSDETVMQLHVPHQDQVNDHPYCLHLWRPVGGAIPVPPAELVGFFKKHSQAATRK
jgi:hypothetical protein